MLPEYLCIIIHNESEGGDDCSHKYLPECVVHGRELGTLSWVCKLRDQKGCPGRGES